MSLKFIKPGLQTSIQDAGRTGLMHQGISRSGAMDSVSLQLANWLVSNDINQAAIEITLVGPTIEFTDSYLIAICGAEFELTLNDTVIVNNKIIHVNKGDVLEFKQLRKGVRAYLAIAGKLKVDKIFASQSTHLTANFGGYKGRQIKAGDILGIKDKYKPNKRELPKEYRPRFSNSYLLRCTEGLEVDSFDKETIKRFYHSTYKISNDSNRMGLRLDGDAVVSGKSVELISTGLVQGSVQVPPPGLPIISSVDGQTIGGYPRIANVISSDLNILGQLKVGDKVNCLLISRENALQQFKLKKTFLDTLLLN